MDFEIILTGVNYRRAGIDIREKYSLANYCTSENWLLNKLDGLRESLILSTCNRVEILGIGGKNIADSIISHWAQKSGGQERELREYIYQYNNRDAVRHLFSVASSLDSMVLGEPQILGQLKNAYRVSLETHNAGPIINRLLHKAFSVAKRVRNETAVAANAVSVSYAAVELAKCIFGKLGDNSVLLLGAGEMAELAALHLVQGGVKKLFVANRTFSAGRELAEKVHGEAISFDRVFEKLQETDIIIASTASSAPIINKANILDSLRNRKNRPMFLIDIAVPRNIDPDVNSLDNVYLYDIDDLKEIVEANRSGREKEAEAAKMIVEEETEIFSRWLESLELQPTLMDLVRQGDAIAERELAKAMKKMGEITPETARVMEMLAYSIVHKLTYPPLDWLKHQGMEKFGQQERIALIRNIFKLDNLDVFPTGNKF